MYEVSLKVLTIYCSIELAVGRPRVELVITASTIIIYLLSSKIFYSVTNLAIAMTDA